MKKNRVIPVWYIRIGNFISFEQAYNIAKRLQGFCNFSEGGIDISQRFLKLPRKERKSSRK